MNPLIILITLIAHITASKWDDVNVTIAVVEYRPSRLSTASKDFNIMENVMRYNFFMEDLLLDKKITADMIIFPEGGIGNDPETAVEVNLKDNPCDLGSKTLANISCSARTYQQYVVINLVSKTKCQAEDQAENCRNYGHLFHNTDVIFDRDGTVVGIYHKYNLYGEKGLDKPEQPETVVIETDFGISFGIFTCFDILFKSPAQDLVQQGVDAVIFPTMWFSELPFLTALQVQQMWSQAHNVKLFAAGANNPQVGSGGTGVYDGRQGAILADIIPAKGSDSYAYQNLVTGAPKLVSVEEIDALAEELDGFYLKTDPGVKEYSSVVLNSTDFDGQVCYNNGQFCCNFSIKTTINTTSGDRNSYTYQLVAYSGVRSFDGLYNGGVEVCGIVACLNSSVSSCGHRFPSYKDIEWPVKFEEVTIKAYFEVDENRTQYPNSLLSSLRPVQANLTTWGEEEVVIEGKEVIERTFSLVEAQDRILTFAIYGRNFALDSPPADDGDDDDDDNNSEQTTRYNLLLICAVVLIFFVKI